MYHIVPAQSFDESGPPDVKITSVPETEIVSFTPSPYLKTDNNIKKTVLRDPGNPREKNTFLYLDKDWRALQYFHRPLNYKKHCLADVNCLAITLK